MKLRIVAIALSLFLFGCTTETRYVVVTATPAPFVEPFAPAHPNAADDAKADQEATGEAIDIKLANDEIAQAAIHKCTVWDDARQHYGENTCVVGNVTSTYDSGKGFFINFTSDRTAFYVVAFGMSWTHLEGACIVVSGKIVEYGNRPEIVVNRAAQVQDC